MKKAILLAALLLETPHSLASCGTAFCSLNTDWNIQDNEHNDHAWLFDIRYESVNQTRLWSGSHSISAAEANEAPLERYTYNRNTVLTADYAWGQDGVSVILPYIDRHHLHINDPTRSAIPEEWDFSALGDIKLLARHQVNTQLGFNAGLKLPTGDYQLANSNGTLAERALQPGSGSTDLIFGGFWHRHTSFRGISWFSQLFYQWAIATQSNFRPGNQFTLVAGFRDPVAEHWIALFQMNYTHRDHDRGLEAEPDMSGLSTLQVSPGLAWNTNSNIQLYGFAQFPLVRQVYGVQLVADKAYIAGVSMSF